MNIEHHDENDTPALKRWLAAARRDLDSREPPGWLEFQLRQRLAERSALNAVRRARESQASDVSAEPVPRLQSGSRWIASARALLLRAPRLSSALAAAATACVALVIGLALITPMRAPLPSSSSGASNAQPFDERSPFIALATLDAIAAESGATVVTARLPRTSLFDFGLPVDPARADVPLNAEFLMSPRGVVLAVRFVE